jgi:predicted nucleotidyltransferase
MEMIDIEALKKEIVERMKPLRPEKIILFGSYANGTPTEDSDIDIYIVGEENFIPKTWNERQKLYLKYSQRLRDLRKNIAIDLIVHTRQMHKKMKELNGSFYRELIQKGQVLYE